MTPRPLAATGRAFIRVRCDALPSGFGMGRLRFVVQHRTPSTRVRHRGSGTPSAPRQTKDRIGRSGGECMRTLGTIVAITALTTLTASVSFAQEHAQNGGWQDSAAYVTGLGGFQAATGSTTGDLLIEGGVRVAPHVMVFGDLGYFRNLQGDLANSLNSAVTSLQNTQ